jgi:hypothetical protein
VHDPSFNDRAPIDRRGIHGAWVVLERPFREADIRHGDKLITLYEQNAGKIRMTELRGAFYDRVEDRLQVGLRSADHAEDVVSCRLLFQRFAKRFRARRCLIRQFRDAPFQPLDRRGLVFDKLPKRGGARRPFRG